MLKHVMDHAPNISKGALILTGATEIRNAFSPEDQIPVINGYMQGIKVTFAMAVAGTGLAFCIGLMTRWKKLKTENLSGGMA